MNDDQFEWDDAKAQSNWKKHAISFDMARDAFRDVFAIEWIDTRHKHGEERINMLATSEGHCLHVTYTMRGDRIRIISARTAEPHERRRYHNENQT